MYSRKEVGSYVEVAVCDLEQFLLSVVARMAKSRHVKVTSGGSSIAKAARLSSSQAHKAKEAFFAHSARGLATIPTAEVPDR